MQVYSSCQWRLRATAFLACLLFIFYHREVNGSLPVAQDIIALKAGVVKITTMPPGEGKRDGTGIIVQINKDVAYIVTATHVVAGDPQPNVQFFSQMNVSVPAKLFHVEGRDDVTGVALLEVRWSGSIPAGLRSLKLTTSTRVSSPAEVDIIGHPKGIGDWVVQKGTIVLRKGRFLTIDGNIEEGSSGGPIIHNGEVVGLIGSAEGHAQGITSGSLRDYLEGHNILIQENSMDGSSEGQTSFSLPNEPKKPKAAGEISSNDRAPMVLVSAGEFMMGTPLGVYAGHDPPPKPVYVPNFYMDKYEVTVGQYAGFLRATDREKPKYWDQVDLNKHDRLPVIGVNWHDADAYCRWAGKRLPTEAEWEKGARGTYEYLYPWGNELPNSSRANFGWRLSNQRAYAEGLKPVGSYEGGKSPYGIYDLCGNVSEWVSDMHNPTKRGMDRLYRSIRGGSFLEHSTTLPSTHRRGMPPSWTDPGLGFRCAQEAAQ